MWRLLKGFLLNMLLELELTGPFSYAQSILELTYYQLLFNKDICNYK